MKFKVRCEVTETELIKISSTITKIIPLYKSKADAADVEWIHQNKDIIIGNACMYVWDKYREAFPDDMILSKNIFYKLVKQELELKGQMMKLANDAVRYCFVDKSTSRIDFTDSFK